MDPQQGCAPDSLRYADFSFKEYLFDRQQDNDIQRYLRIIITTKDTIPGWTFTNRRFTVNVSSRNRMYVTIDTLTDYVSLMHDLQQIEYELREYIIMMSGVNPTPMLKQSPLQEPLQ